MCSDLSTSWKAKKCRGSELTRTPSKSNSTACGQRDIRAAKLSGDQSDGKHGEETRARPTAPDRMSAARMAGRESVTETSGARCARCALTALRQFASQLPGEADGGRAVRVDVSTGLAADQ